MSDKTPDPSRRFLPPSSSSTQKSSVKKPVLSFSQFPPSSSSASPFPQASRFQTPARPKNEDINTSFDDEREGTSHARPQIPTPLAVPGADAIDDFDVGLPRGTLVKHLQHDIDSEFGEQENAAFRFLKGNRDDPATPLPKRRKVSAHVGSSTERVLITSSPTFHQAEKGDYEDDDRPPVGPEDPSDRGTTTPLLKSRFKSKTPGPLLDEEDGQKPSFRHPDTASRLNAEMTMVLPEAFTPSRKKGKTDYIAGGLADTIRNMILSIATEAAQKGGLDETPVIIRSARLDKSRRAIIATDEEDVLWILASQHAGGATDEMVHKLDGICASGQILIRGSATRWTLSLEGSGGTQEVRCATHWEVEAE